jgi:Flavin reductase like domain
MNANHEIQDVMATMPYGLYIVASRDGDELDGMMADWVMQVSFEPRLLAVSFENNARTLENIRATGGFTVNLLSEQEASMLPIDAADPLEMLREDRAEWDALVVLLDAHPRQALHRGTSVWTSRDIYAHLARWIEHCRARLPTRRSTTKATS